MIKNIIFCIITLLLLTHNFVSRLMPYEYQYLLWMSTILLSLTGVSFLLLTEVPYQKYFRKFSSFLIFDISAYALVDFIVVTFAREFDLAFLKYLSVFVGLGLTVVFIRSYIKFFIRKSDVFERNASYLVYKYPKSLWGILSSIYTAPYGHCFLLIDRKKFYYHKKDGLIEELLSTNQIQKQSDKLFFRKIPDVDVEEARKLIGRKWTIFNNCFSTFSRFR